MKRLIGTLFLCLITLNSFAQGSQTVQDPFDSLYDGGYEAYSRILRQTLTVPRSLYGSKDSGFVIFEISVQSTGEVSAKMMTKFNEDTEKSTIRGIQATVSGWVVHPNNYKVYQPILFNSNILDQTAISESLKDFPESFEYPILPAIELTTMGITRSVQRISSSAPVGSESREIPKRLANEAGKKTKSGTLDNSTLQIESMKAQLDKHLGKGKSKKAYAVVSDILKLNPFDKSLIQQRRRLEKELGKDEYRVYDILWLQALDQIKQTQSNMP